MKKAHATLADNLSPLGGAVPTHDPAETPPQEHRDLVVLSTPVDELPPVLTGHLTSALQARAESFYRGVAEMFERCAARRGSSHTQRAYRREVLSFVEFLGIRWPEQAEQLLRASVGDVQRWRDGMREQSKAPKTLNRRISSLFQLLQVPGRRGCRAAPANQRAEPGSCAQFIARESSDPLKGTRALSATRARRLMGLPAGDGMLDYRDRAILKTYLYTGVRLATACRLRVRDFHQDGEEATLTINEKCNRHRTIGTHFAAAEAISEYIAKAGLKSGPLFRARRAPRADELGEKPMSEASMYRVVADYLAKLPGAAKEGTRIFSTHSLRATTVTLLLDAGNASHLPYGFEPHMHDSRITAILADAGCRSRGGQHRARISTCVMAEW